jgi:hypothetical protein
MMFRDANHRVMRATVGRGARDRCEPILVDEMKQRKVAP